MLFPCPFCGPRDETEFTYVGEPKARPEPAEAVSDAAWAELSLRQRQSEGRGAGDLAASDLHGDVRHDPRHARPTPSSASEALEGRADERLPPSEPAARSIAAGRSPSPSTASPISAAAGDSIASALLANGVRIVGRSFKYHRPRGVWGAWTEEPNAIVDVTRDGRTTPNLRATVEPLENDLAVRSVNAAPTAAEDRAGAARRLCGASCRPASTTRPSSGRAGRRSSRSIRAHGGPRRASIPTIARRPTVRSFNAHCDLLVVGAGPAGLAAAARGRESGARRVPRRRPRRDRRPARRIAAARSKAATGANGREASRAAVDGRAAGA